MIFLASNSSSKVTAARDNFSSLDLDPVLSESLTNEEFVRRFQLTFDLLNQRERESLLVLADANKFNAGEAVLEAGIRSDQLYLVLSGSVTMMHEELAATTLSVGDVFGESAFVRGDGELFSYVTAEETVLLAIDFSYLNKLVRINPYFERRLEPSLSELHAHKLDLFEAQLC
ncbi:MAG: cyclic nucleotide-binding domain-containing protein [Rhodospirillaceae bacterium]|nr:cyclic nucleotide-binding domain-containing protein [Rhodospirillaceae bacterium]